MRHEPRYEARVFDTDKDRPLTTWQFMPDPRMVPRPGGMQMAFEIPSMTCISRGLADLIEVRCDGEVVFRIPLNRAAYVFKKDTFNIDEAVVDFRMGA